jgi:hypothetical protein
VVVIEDSMPGSVDYATVGAQMFGGKLRFRLPNQHLIPSLVVPTPAWMDPNVIMQGGNVVHRYFSFGAAQF